MKTPTLTLRYKKFSIDEKSLNCADEKVLSRWRQSINFNEFLFCWNEDC